MFLIRGPLLWVVVIQGRRGFALEVNLVLGPVGLLGAWPHGVRRVASLLRFNLAVVAIGEAWYIIVARTRRVLVHRDLLG